MAEALLKEASPAVSKHVTIDYNFVGAHACSYDTTKGHLQACDEPHNIND